MMIRGSRFNIYLLLLVIASLAVGCNSDKVKAKKVRASFRLHQEIYQEGQGNSQRVTVGRDHPISFAIDSRPFLTESMVKEAKVVENMGSYALAVSFDQEGSWLLEQYSASNRGRHLLIFCQFFNPGEEKLNTGRWLAAPRCRKPMTDGMLVFTPDATREELDQIVLGLNNTAKIIGTGRAVKF